VGITFAAGAPVLVGACGGGDGGEATTATGSPDVDVLNAMLDVEFTSVAAYRAAMPRLRGAPLTAAARLLAQERAHAAVVTQAIRRLGGKPIKPKANYNFPALAGEGDVLGFITSLENTAIAAFLDALPKLADPALRGLTAAILANEAEHVSVLAGVAHRNQTPTAFVTGQG
jgi:ferritin-like protein